MISCILPFYNDGKNISNIISLLKKILQISEIILVDDGSDEKSQKSIPNNGIILVSSLSNEGKSAAVFRGLAIAKNENIFILDSDLEKLKQQEIEKACKIFLSGKNIDCLILKIQGDNKIIDSLLRNDVCLSGNRFLKKVDLERIRETKPQRYQLETAINKYLMDNKKNNFWYKTSGYNPHKVKKFGFVKGLVKDTVMQKEILSFAGLRQYFRQIIFFAKKEIHPQ